MLTNSQKVSEFRKRRKLNLIHVCGDKCNLCGYDKNISALEFHHINPATKEYEISSGVCHDLEKDLAEIKKCILVCANCHREIHDGLYRIDELIEHKIFDENVANELRQDKIQKTTAKEYFCDKCGKKISRYSDSGLCFDCMRKQYRVVEQRPSRDELKQMIRALSFTKIAEQYNVSDNAVRKWCKAENLPSTKKEINAIKDLDWKNI